MQENEITFIEMDALAKLQKKVEMSKTMQTGYAKVMALCVAGSTGALFYYFFI